MMSYAEDEADVEGTVNGVTNTASGERWELGLLPPGVGVGAQSASRGFLGRKVSRGHLQTAFQHYLPSVFFWK